MSHFSIILRCRGVTPGRPFSDQAKRKTTDTQVRFNKSTRCARQFKKLKASSESNEDGTLPVMGDWRSFRAKLVADGCASGNGWATRRTQPNFDLLKSQDPTLAQEELWAHHVGFPEQGGLVIASTGGQNYLPPEYWQAVVFLGAHSEEGSVGFILNRPTGLTMGRTPLSGPAGKSQLCEIFPTSRVYMGGLIAQQVINMVHRFKSIDGSKEVVPGIYLGGQRAAGEAVLGGKYSAEAFKFFSGCIIWGPGELERDVAAGAWHCAACSRSLVLKHCIGLPVPLWGETLKLMGGSHAAEAEAALNNNEYEGS